MTDGQTLQDSTYCAMHTHYVVKNKQAKQFFLHRTDITITSKTVLLTELNNFHRLTVK